LPLFYKSLKSLAAYCENHKLNDLRQSRRSFNFSRWRDNYQYHIDDLSTVVVPDHPLKESKLKYLDWVNTLFHEYPSYQPKLNKHVIFGVKHGKEAIQVFGVTLVKLG